MVIYVDVLIFVNTVIDYILLSAASCVLKRDVPLKRIILASFFGGITSLYIFAGNTTLIADVAFKLFTTVLTVIIAYGLLSINNFILAASVLLGMTFLLNGAFTFIYNTLNRNTVFSENMVSYINISPIMLIIITAVLYTVIYIIRYFYFKCVFCKTALLNFNVAGYSKRCTALVDSGNSVSDPFGNSEVFIINREAFNELERKLDENELNVRKRVIPIKTVGNKTVLSALRADSAEIIANNERFRFSKVIIASSSEDLTSDFDAIIPLSSVSGMSYK